MDERVQEAVEFMLQDVLFMKQQEQSLDLEDMLLFAYQHLIDMEQWRLQLTRDELDEAWERVRETIQRQEANIDENTR
ncbi:MAG: hypothetical protein KatS3mg022_3426 [Armatimonadota bacterium]|nr:MAG: hypothetical protein KatS3mg022_3426 [Armatimonadota bacterium]GIV21297.1 MAG: hypothetical protein KatS3mg023_3048 [Armatimonadota bacterium]GIV22019.1 MAG: hypothetical protein KatS3mg023_3770 [Armatimonadota bacterium]